MNLGYVTLALAATITVTSVLFGAASEILTREHLKEHGLRRTVLTSLRGGLAIVGLLGLGVAVTGGLLALWVRAFP